LLQMGKLSLGANQTKSLKEKQFVIEGQEISKIDLKENLTKEYPDEDILDANGQYIMPGLICAHTQFLQCLFSRIGNSR